MSDEDSTNPPGENKLPRLKIPGRSDRAGDAPEKVTPEVGKISEVESDTTKLELSEAIPGGDDASKNATMRISIDEAVLPGSGRDPGTGETQPMGGGQPGDGTIRLDVDELEVEKGKTGPIKSDTTKLSLEDAIEGKDTSKIFMDTETPKAGMGETMAITDLGITSEIKSDTTKLDLAEALKERATKAPKQGSPAGRTDQIPGAPDAEGIRGAMPADEDFFKSATVPIEGSPADATEEGIQEDRQIEDEFFKSATIPIDTAAEEAEEGIQETGRMDDDFFKSATMPIDVSNEAAGAPAPGADRDPDDDFFKSATVPIKDLPDSEENPAKDRTMSFDAVSAAAGARPRTIKIKKPSAKQLDTVKLQKSPAAEDEVSQTGPDVAAPAGRKQTVKLKRGGTGTSAGKTLEVSRPPAGASGRSAPARSFNADEAVMGAPNMPGAVFSILALLSFFLTCTGLYFLYSAFTTIAG